MGAYSLLVQFDDEAQELRYFEVDSSGKHELAIRVPLEVYREKGPDEAERLLGETIFTFLDRFAPGKIGLRTYVQDAKDRLASGMEGIRARADAGDARAQYHLAIDHMTSAVRNRSIGQVEEAEMWLRRSAAGGCADAIEYLSKHWEREKAAAVRSIRG